MVACRHLWEMTDVEFGFVAFERCFHCDGLRTFFTREQAPFLGEEYREGQCFWRRVENAQSFRFSLRCVQCGERHTFEELMGLLYCTGCDPDCAIDMLKQKAEAEGYWILVGFGFTNASGPVPIPPYKLEILADYFNQHREATRPKVRLLSFEHLAELSRCQGDFLHDVGMLSVKRPPSRKSPIASPASELDGRALGPLDQEKTNDDQ